MLNEAGEAFIEGPPRMKVRLLVGHGLTNGWSPEEFKWQFSQLTMAQVHAALTYHYDHQSKMDAENAVDLQQSEKGTLAHTSLDFMSVTSLFQASGLCAFLIGNRRHPEGSLLDGGTVGPTGAAE